MSRSSGAERRRNIRVFFNAAARVTQTEADKRIVISEETRDLSLQGVYVLTTSPLTPGTECMVELRLEGSSSDLKIRIRGQVVRVDDQGMGIRFESMDIDALIHLKNILYYNSGDPERIDSEMAGFY